MQTRETLDALSIASNTDSKTLTPPEAQELSRCEQIIRKGCDTFVEVAVALLQICDQHLYRSTHDTFEHYCRDKWKFTARYANRLMLAGTVVENIKSDQLVSSVPTALPQNEAQARSLTRLTPPQQIEVSRKVAAKTDKPSSNDFKDEANKITGKKPRVTVADQVSTKTSTGTASMGALIELIDEVQTMVKVGKPKEAVLAKLKNAANLATRINNGGSLC